MSTGKAWLAIAFFAFPAAAERQIHIDAQPNGTMKTPLSANVAVNERSTLSRIAMVVNDSTCPIQIAPGTGLKAVWIPDRVRGEYQLQAHGSLSSSQVVAAIDLRFIVIDVFAKSERTLRHVLVRDTGAGAQFPIESGVAWRANEGQVTTFATSVAFVAAVRLGDGSVWTADHSRIRTEISALQLDLGANALEAAPDQP